MNKIKCKLAELRKRAKKKNVDFDLTAKWYRELMSNTQCEQTGLRFKIYKDGRRHPFGPSIHRVDCTKGYIKSNCQLVIWAYNTAKAEFTDEDVYKMAKAYLTNEK